MSRFIVKTNHNDFLVNADGISINTEQVTNDVGLLKINYDETTTMIAGFNLQALKCIQNSDMSGSKEYRIESCIGQHMVQSWTVMADTLALYNGCVILGTDLADGSMRISAIYNGLYYSVMEQRIHERTMESIPVW